MLNCDYCTKTYKTETGLKKHLYNIHPNRDVQFIYYSSLPIDLHFEIFKFLSATDLLSIFNAHITPIFFGDFNNLWINKCSHIATNNRRFIFKSYGLTFLKYINLLCFYCFDKCTYKTINNPFYHLPICSICQKIYLPMITKTTAKNRYLLTNTQLAELPSICVDNPHYRKASNMTLFLEKDCQYVAADDLEEKIQHKLDASNKRKENRQEREISLKNALTKVGLKIRPDSKLCQEFIDDRLDEDIWTLDKVVEMCQEMNWLHTKTNYRQLLKTAISDEIELYKSYSNCYNFQDIYDDIEPQIRKKIKDEFLLHN